MTLRHLEIFLAVAQEGKMGEAARKLHISQPTISQAIREIEGEYQVQLFERLSRKLYITEAGKTLLSYARHMVSLNQEMDRYLRYSASHLDLKVGASITVGSCVLAPLVRNMEQGSPGLQVQVYVENTRLIEEKILQSELDLGLVEGSVHSHDLICVPVVQDELVLVCAPSHPFGDRDFVDPQDLRGRSFLLREDGSGTRALFQKSLAPYGVEVRAKWVCHSFNAILSAVEQGQGIGVISSLLVDRLGPNPGLHVLRIQGVPLMRSFQVVYHRDKYFSKACRLFLGEVQAHLPLLMPHSP